MPKVLKTLYEAIQTGQVLSAHDVSEGGVVTAIFEMCLGGGLGASVEGTSNLLFNETAGTFIVEVENEEIFKRIPYQILGKVTDKTTLKVKNLFEVEIKELEKAWKKPMEAIFNESA